MEDFTFAVTLTISVAICVGLRSIKEKYFEIYKKSGLSNYVFLVYVFSWAWILLDTLVYGRVNQTLAFYLLAVPFMDCVGILATALTHSWLMKQTESILKKEKDLEPEIRKIIKDIESVNEVRRLKKKGRK